MFVRYTYEAWDGSQFDTADACLAHEQKCHDYMEEAQKYCVFFDSAREIIHWPYERPEDFGEAFSYAYDKCDFLHIRISNACREWLHFEFGFILPEANGYYMYNNDKWEWERL